MGSNLEELTKLVASQAASLPTNSDELMKCLQALCGKNGTDLFPRLPPMNDLPVQSVSSQDFSRGSTASSSSRSSCGALISSVAGPSSSMGKGTSASASGRGASFNNSTTINNGISSHQKQDTINLVSAQHQNINQFKIPETQTRSPHQQQPSHHKPVLSLHQQAQNDLSRRLNNNPSTATASIANLNAATSNMNDPSSSNTTIPSFDTNTLSAFDTSLGINSSSPYNAINNNNNNNNLMSHVSNIMETLGTCTSTDNIFNDNNSFQHQASSSINGPSNHSQQSLIKHQHLQKLLKSSGNNQRFTPLTPPTKPSETFQLDPPDRFSGSNKYNTRIQRLLTSPASSTTSSQPHPNLPSVPKSLLNLAACSSSSNSSSISSLTSKLSSLTNRNTNNLLQSANLSNTSLASNSRSTQKTSVNSSVGSSILTGSDLQEHNNLIQQQTLNEQCLLNTRPSLSASGLPRAKHQQAINQSLLSEDHSKSGFTKPSLDIGSLSQAFQSSIFNDNSTMQSVFGSKEAFLACIQEKVAKAGLSIGELAKQTTLPVMEAAATTHSGNCFGSRTKEDSSFMSDRDYDTPNNRGDDLSLLNPPNSTDAHCQKYMNALTVGLKEAEMLTNDVRKIVEECNIIYECKSCKNLFRSLNNLVKHKRDYCYDQDLSTSQSSVPHINSPSSQPVAELQALSNQGKSSENSSRPHTNPRISVKDNNSNEPASETLRALLRSTKPHDRRENSDSLLLKTPIEVNNSQVSGTHPYMQTSLSKLLQKRPKGRNPVDRENALIDALNTIPTANDISSQPNSKCMSVSEQADICSPLSDINEQMVRNSSLAKTLLTEKVKSIKSNQSLMELFKTNDEPLDSSGSVDETRPTRPGPKRKLLEDCIQKVKREKLKPDDDTNDAVSNSDSSSSKDNDEDNNNEEDEAGADDNDNANLDGGAEDDNEDDADDEEDGDGENVDDEDAESDDDTTGDECGKHSPTDNKDTPRASSSTVTVASSSSSGSSSGLMKLKIQLKTQPDEKSKVYRIV